MDKSSACKGLIALILFFTSISLCQAQEDIRIYVLTFPQNAYLELDGQKIIPSDSGSLTSVGTHHLRVWLPDYSIVDSTITVKKEDYNIFRIYLKLSPQYISYQRSLQNYKIKKVTHMIPPVASFVIGVAFCFLANKEANQSHDDAIQNEKDYAASLDQESMDYYKKSYDENTHRYKSYKVASYAIAGLCIIPLTWTIKVAMKNAHSQPPVKPNY
jgi:hypothetical protein